MSKSQKRERIDIIGRGRLGRSLALALRRRGAVVRSYAARSERSQMSGGDVVIIATRDGDIARVARDVLARRANAPRVMIHLAGSLPPDILPSAPGMQRLTMHPIQTFSKPDASLFEGITWMVVSASPQGVAWSRRFVKSLGSAGIVVLKPRALPIYHAMTVFASNYITLLGSVVEDLGAEAGVPARSLKPALAPLMRAALENVLAAPAASVLTGPISRGDAATIAKHRSALRRDIPEIELLYAAFVRYAKAKGLGPK